MAKAFLNVMKRELQRVFKKPVILFIMFVIPLFCCFFLGETFKSASVKDLNVAVLNEDNSSISRTIVRMIDATPTCKVAYHVTNLSEGKELLVGGKAYALIYIPRDFQRDIFRGTQPQLVYYYNNQMLLIGGVITKDVTMAVQTVLAGINVKVQTKKGLPRDVAISQVNVINVDEHVKANPYMNYSYFLSMATFVHTFQVLIAFLAIWSVGLEFKEGTTLEWMNVAENSILIGVLGKLLPYTIGFMFIIALTYLTYFLGYGAPFEGNIWFTVLSTLVFIFAYQFMGLMYVAITANFRLSLSCGAFYTALGFTFAGMTYPVIAMPAFARFYSALLPLRPYLASLIDQSLRGIPYYYDWGYIWWMLALATFGFMFLPLLKKRALDEKQWYKL